MARPPARRAAVAAAAVPAPRTASDARGRRMGGLRSKRPHPSRWRLRSGLAALLTVAASAPLASQEPEPADTTPAPAAPTPAAAEAPDLRPARVAVSVTGGILGFSRLQVQPVLAERTGADGAVTESTLRRTISAESGYQVQGSVLVSLGPAWALRAGVGIGWATLTAGYSGDDEEIVDEARALPEVTGGSLELTTAEGALRFRLPVGGSVRSYAEVGVAAERWSLATADTVVPGTEALLEPSTRFGAHVAVGATVPLASWVDGRIQLSTRLLRTPLGTATVGAPLSAGDSLRLTAAEPAAAPFADGTVELTRVLRLEAGLSFRLGRAGGPPSPAAVSGDAPSGTPR